MTALTLTRLARRTARGGGWRHVLVVGLIALAVGAAVAVAIAARSMQPTLEERVTWQLGQADAVVTSFIEESEVTYAALPPELQAYVDDIGAPHVEGVAPLNVRAAVTEVAPDAELVPVVERWGLRLGDVRGSLVTADLDLAVIAGTYLPDGPSPQVGEALASPDALRGLGAGVGDRVTLDGVGAVTIVGTVTDPDQLRSPIVLVPPAASVTAASTYETTHWFVTLPRTDPEVLRSTLGNREQLHVETRGSVAGGWAGTETLTEEPTFVGTLVGVALLIQVALVSAAAFATGTRRRLRELGLLGAIGAEPRQVHGLVVREALVLGVLGGALGAGAGVLFAWLGRPLMTLISSTAVAGLDVHWLDLSVPAVLGAGAAIVAASLPARTAARVPAATALAGRMPVRSVPRWLTPAAFASFAVGLGLLANEVRNPAATEPESVLVVGAGAVLAVGGAAALAVPLVGLLGRVADRLPLRFRLVARDAARQRTRSAAAIGALTVVLVVPILTLTQFATDQARWGGGRDANVREDVVTVSGPRYANGLRLPPTEQMLADATSRLPAVEERVDVTLLGAATDAYTRVRMTRADGPGGLEPIAAGGDLGLATPDLLTELGIGQLWPHVADGGLLIVGSRHTGLGQPLLGVQRLDVVTEAADVATGETRTSATVELPVRSVEIDVATHGLPDLLVSEPTAERLGLQRVGEVVLLDLERALTPAEARRLWEVSGPGTLWTVEAPVSLLVVDVGAGMALVVAASLVVALIITGMTAALAATESDRDLRLMTAVGAEPRLRRVFHGLQSGLHASLAAVLAVPTGLLVFRATVVERVHAPGMVVPWAWVAVLAIGVPLVVGVAHRTLMRRSPVEAPRRIA